MNTSKKEKDIIEVAEKALKSYSDRKLEFKTREHQFRKLALMWSHYLNLAHSEAENSTKYEITSKDAAVMMMLIHELRLALGDGFVDPWTKGLDFYDKPIDEVDELCDMLRTKVASSLPKSEANQM